MQLNLFETNENKATVISGGLLFVGQVVSLPPISTRLDGASLYTSCEYARILAIKDGYCVLVVPSNGLTHADVLLKEPPKYLGKCYRDDTYEDILLKTKDIIFKEDGIN